MFCEMSGGIDSLSERELLTDRFIFDDVCELSML